MAYRLTGPVNQSSAVKPTLSIGVITSYVIVVGAQVPGGLSLRESFYLAEEIAATGRLAVLDIAEVNPLLSNADAQKTTIANAVDVTAKFYGSKRQGDVPKDYVIPRPQA
ncbi:arginase [Elysia marginata]|uniref:Arginase n=1 Tax=Elysia marginata TaxID=1093978 RepID=A0AAV4GDL4_9GAST|nr:arginase [Elysia marginata]